MSRGSVVLKRGGDAIYEIGDRTRSCAPFHVLIPGWASIPALPARAPDIFALVMNCSCCVRSNGNRRTLCYESNHTG
jgi:hypothetical protein